MDQLLALLKCGRRLQITGFVAAYAVNKRLVVKVIGDRRHATSHEFGTIKPSQGRSIVCDTDEVKSTRGLLLYQYIGSLPIAAIARSACAGIHVVTKTAIHTMSLRRAQRCAPTWRLTDDAELGAVHERVCLLNADQAIASNHDYWQCSGDISPELIWL